MIIQFLVDVLLPAQLLKSNNFHRQLYQKIIIIIETRLKETPKLIAVTRKSYTNILMIRSWLNYLFFIELKNL